MREEDGVEGDDVAPASILLRARHGPRFNPMHTAFVRIGGRGGRGESRSPVPQPLLHAHACPYAGCECQVAVLEGVAPEFLNEAGAGWFLCEQFN